MMTIVEEYRPILMVVTFGLLGCAFYLTYRPGATVAAGSRNRWMAFNKLMLWGVTVIAVVMLCFPHALPGLSASGGRFTADMQRTVIQIEGMT